MRKNNFLLIALALAIVGFIPIVTGFVKLNEAHLEEEMVVEKNAYTGVPKIKVISGNSVPFSTMIEDKLVSVSYAFYLKTNDTFAVDNRIDYTVDLYVSEPDLIKNAVLVFGVRDENYTGVTISDADVFVKERSRLFGDTIQLFRVESEPNRFTRTGHIVFPLEGNLQLHFIPITKNGDSGELPFNDPIVTINPSLAKLQADTNRATLEQIEELKESTRAQNVSNKRIEGLTWITVGAIPILICADILLRLYFEEKT